MALHEMDTTTAKIPLRTHWIPRFLSSGVENDDLQDLLRKIDRWDIWCREWSAKAEYHERQGEAALAEGHSVTAGQALGRAAVYYHFAGFRFYEDMSQKDAADRKAWDCYRRAAPHFTPPAEALAVPYEGMQLPAYLRIPPGVSNAPCVIIIAGMDSRKEEFFFSLEREFLARGMATVSYDAPGQGDMWEQAKMREDNEKATLAILDHVARHSQVDENRIGVYGWAMGGYFAPRAAVADRRVKACVSMPVRYGLEEWDELGKMQTDAYQYLFGQVSYEEGRKLAANFSLEGILPRLTCPYLIVHGARGDTVDVSEPERAAREAGGPTRLEVFEDGDHLCLNIRHKSWPLMMDWFADNLSA